MIFWGGPSHCTGNLDLHHDIDDLEGEGEPTDHIYYNRRIEALSSKQITRMILESAEYEGFQSRTTLTHPGILDGTDKITNLHYCDGQDWHNWNFAE